MKKYIAVFVILLSCACRQQDAYSVKDTANFKSEMVGVASDAGYHIYVYKIKVDSFTYIVVNRGESIAITKQ